MLQMIVSKARVATCALLAMLCMGAAARADITMTGTGKVIAVPDIAHIFLVVETHADTAETALEANSAAMQRLFKLLKPFGIAERDVQTTDLGVNPIYRHPKSGAPVLVGYSITNQITVKVRKLPDTGKVLGALLKERTIEVSGVTLTVADPEKLLDDARVRAMAQAHHKAQLYAKGANARLGGVKSIAEQFAVPQLEWRLAPAAVKSGVILPPGEKELSITVNVVYAIGAGDM
jgi:uncharacterized protein YggE